MNGVKVQIPQLRSSKTSKKSLSVSHSVIDSKVRTTKVQSHHFPLLSRVHSNSRMSYYDPEEQKDIINKLKKDINQLRQQLTQAKSQNQYFQREIDKADLDQNEDEAQTSPKLLLKVKKLYSIIAEKDAEIKELKRRMKLDESHSLRAENEKLSHLCTLQQQQLASLLNQKDQDTQVKLLQSLENDNVQLVAIIKNLEGQLKELEGFKRNSFIHANKINSQKQLIIALQSEIRKFKDRDLLFSQKNNQTNKDQALINKLKQEINKLSQSLQENQEELNHILDQHSKQVKKFDQILLQKDDEMLQIKARCDSLQKALFDEYAISSSLRKSRDRGQTILKPSPFSQSQQVHKSQDVTPLQSQRSLATSNYKVNIQKQDLQLIQKIIKLQMISKGLTLDDIEQVTIVIKNPQSTYSAFEELYEAIKSSTLSLSEKQAAILASYLIDSDDENLIQENQRIRCILKAFMENYRPPTLEEQQSLRQSIVQCLGVQLPIIISFLKQKQPNQIIHNFSDLQEALITYDVKLSKQQLEYLEAHLFQLNNNTINLFDVQQLANLFL